MTRSEQIEILKEAQEQMAEALETIRRIADPNKMAYVVEHLDGLINTPMSRHDQSLLTWIEELYNECDDDEECPEEGSEDERRLLGQ